MIYMDERWDGAHGIGRFAREVARTLPHALLTLPGKPMAPWDPVRLSIALARTPPGSIFFSPGYNAPISTSRRFVLTVHDLNHLDRPENSSVAKRLYYELVLKRACRNAAAILTVSDFSRRRILDWSGAEPAVVFNVGNGVSPSFNAEVEAFAPGYPYVLCVSNRRLHKNEERLIQAFDQSRLDTETRLAFTGDPTPALSKEIARLLLSDRVVFLGTVAEAALPSVYRGARCLAFPSLYEGFGLPVIEAFASGTPVVTSSTTSLAEVAGNAALLVDPESIPEIAAAIRTAATDEPTRSRLIQHGLDRAAFFTWPAVSGRISDVFDTVCGG